MAVFRNKDEQIFAPNGAAAHVLPQFLAVAAEDIKRDFAGERLLQLLRSVAPGIIDMTGGQLARFAARVKMLGVINLRNPEDVMSLRAVFLRHTGIATDPAQPRHRMEIGFHLAPRFRRIKVRTQHRKSWQGAQKASLLVNIIAVVHQNDAVILRQTDEMAKKVFQIGALFGIQRIEIASTNLHTQSGIECIQICRRVFGCEQEYFHYIRVFCNSIVLGRSGIPHP